MASTWKRDTELDALAHDPEIKPLLYERKKQGDVEVEVQRNYLRPYQRAEREKEVRDLERVLEDPIAARAITNPGQFQQKLRILKRDVVDQTPPPLTPSQRDKIANLNRKTAAFARDGMVPEQDMRRKTTGTVDAHLAWQKGTKRAVLLWKATQLLLNPDADPDQQDLCNFEKFRPTRPTQALDLDAQIPGVFTLSPQAKANYDDINWDSPEVAEQIQRLISEGKVRVNTGVTRGALRTPKDGGKVYEDTETGQIFSGPMAKARYTRHMKQKERMTRIAEATP